MRKKQISIVLPLFNESESLDELYSRLVTVIDQHEKYAFEMIFVDNASTDTSLEKLVEFSELDKRVKVIVNNRNFGHIKSPYWGVLQANGDAVICMASDLQDPPEIIADLIKHWESGYKVVLATKPNSVESFFMRNVRKLYYRLLNLLSDVDIVKDATGFGLYDKAVLQILKDINDPHPYFRGLVQEFGFSLTTVEFVQPMRRHGITKNNFLTLYDMALLGFISHSILPIRIASFLGLLIGLFAFVSAIVALIVKLIWWNIFATGQAGIIILVLFVSGLILFFIGILGEYIGAIHVYLKKRPIVVEKQRINFD